MDKKTTGKVIFGSLMVIGGMISGFAGEHILKGVIPEVTDKVISRLLKEALE